MKKTYVPYKPPVTYVELVEHAREDLNRRLAALKKAEKYIRAIEPDLKILRDQHGLNFSRSDYSFALIKRLVGSEEPGSLRDVNVLQLSTAYFSGARDRYVPALMTMGWLFECESVSGDYGRVILRKPKTQIRIEVETSPELREKLKNPEAACS